MENLHFYQSSVEWKKGRIGKLSSPGMESIDTATPPDFAGGVPNIWSPEHLFTASVNICLMNTFLAIAENSKLNFKAFTSNASGKVEKVDGKYMVTEIELKPKIVIADEKDRERAVRIIEKAKNACLISNSVKSEISMKPEIALL
ncbi:MAG TPA: OsmC family protein [Ignavibacteriaceae bacterium]|nr:OsmC family protein [Ignavibacteriaceae bacterium]